MISMIVCIFLAELFHRTGICRLQAFGIANRFINLYEEYLHVLLQIMNFSYIATLSMHCVMWYTDKFVKNNPDYCFFK